MEENNVNNTAAPAGKNGKGLGIAGMVIGIIATILSLMLVIGMEGKVKEKIASETGNVMDKVKDELNKSGAMDQLKELTDTTQAH